MGLRGLSPKRCLLSKKGKVGQEHTLSSVLEASSSSNSPSRRPPAPSVQPPLCKASPSLHASQSFQPDSLLERDTGTVLDA